MSGEKYFKNKILENINRRSFLLQAGLLSSGILLNACLRKFTPQNNSYSHIKGGLKGPNAKAGHILRDKITLPKPTSNRAIKTLIIGGGIAGLSAARCLKKNGIHDFELLELEENLGGNSSFGKNETSSYPLGAHYITLANNHDKELLDFLEECEIISHYEDGLPFYNEFALCFEPEERLLINGQWQEGLIPEFGVPDKDKKQIQAFIKMVEALKPVKGSDDKYAFDLPLVDSSADVQFRKLDKISFKDYLKNEGYDSDYLHWYLAYCCKDEYGQKLENVSAWAGLHYFASRKGKAANAEDNAIITWPEGNGYLMSSLATPIKNHINSAMMVYSLNEKPDGKISVEVYDLKTQKTSSIIAEKVILCAPQFVNNKLLVNWKREEYDLTTFNYAPWVVANITVNALPNNKGAGICWDNVPYNTASVGYVNANHQSLKLSDDKMVFTYYLPLCERNPKVERIAAYSRTYKQWLDIIIPEMEFMHPNITDSIENIEICVWGHGMISPAPGFIWGQNRENALKPIDDKIFFAHTDLSGISIFEEAFHQGIRAAKEVLIAYGNSKSV